MPENPADQEVVESQEQSIRILDELEDPGLENPPPESADVFTAGHVASPYEGYTIQTQYINSSGLTILPTAKDDGSAVIVKTSQPFTQKVVTWAAERRGAKPAIPGFDTSDPNEIGISQVLTFMNSQPLANGGTIWRASGVNTYACLQPKTEESSYPIGSTPAEIASAKLQRFEPYDFQDDIIDASE
jgi:hypothetical protein